MEGRERFVAADGEQLVTGRLDSFLPLAVADPNIYFLSHDELEEANTALLCCLVSAHLRSVFLPSPVW
jgi:hypothetical protein